ncbi:MAG: hypothetical protein Q9221_001884 [Calogaya cf. arnoldii]
MPATFVKRTVSPLRFESLRPDPEDILCPGSDADETLEGHEAKRRRVEQAGEQYLRGKPLYIASARLKGPFTCGWSNLYATRKRRAEASETRSRTGRQRSIKQDSRQVIAPGCQDIPIEISSHETEPTPNIQSLRGTSAEHSIKQVSPGYVRRPRTKKDKPQIQHYSTPATSNSPDRTGTPEDANTSKPQGRDWLKSGSRSKAILQKSTKLPTPSPVPSSQGQTEVRGTRRRQTTRSATRSNSRGSKESNAIQEAHFASESALHAPASSEKRQVTPEDRHSSPKQHSAVKEVKLSNTYPGTQRAHKTVERLSQVAAEQAQDHLRLPEAKNLPEPAILRAREASTAKESVIEYNEPDTTWEALQGRQAKSKRSPHIVPPSTNLPEFEYRSGSRETPRSPERKSFKEDLEAAKKKARAEKQARADKKWRLSFRASGSVKGRDTKASFDGTRLSQLSQRTSGTSPSADPSSVESKKQIEKSAPQDDRDKETTTRSTELLPEAQVVQEPAAKIPSGPSTGVLETDKLSRQFPSTEEGDSYLGLSTQAAMLKAQRTFQTDLASPTGNRVDPPLPRIRDNRGRGNDAVPDEVWEVVDPPAPNRNILTPKRFKEPLNTQAMIDAISPFADTTIKKRPALDRRPSSTSSGSEPSSSLSPAGPNFENTSLSMSTSPSPTPMPQNNNPAIPLSALSKPTSSVTSFSIAPNGTMTEVFQQDGQRAQDDLMGDLDLEAVIEDAGSFLGTWNLDKEARNQERSTGSKASTAKAPQSH